MWQRRGQSFDQAAKASQLQIDRALSTVSGQVHERFNCVQVCLGDEDGDGDTIQYHPYYVRGVFTGRTPTPTRGAHVRKSLTSEIEGSDSSHYDFFKSAEYELYVNDRDVMAQPGSDRAGTLLAFGELLRISIPRQRNGRSNLDDRLHCDESPSGASASRGTKRPPSTVACTP